jgi:phosphatidylinositol alpha-mannosyltransferase
VPLYYDGTVSRFGLNPLAFRRVRSLLERGRFDVIHIHEPLTPLVPWMFLLGQRRGLRVGTFHVHREGAHRVYAAFSPLLKHLARSLDHRIAVSAAAAQTAARYFPGKYEIIPNGVDVARFAGGGSRPAGLGDSRPNVLFVGRLEERKGLQHLVRAMPRVAGAVPGARLVVVGEGPERAETEALARSLSVPVVFAGPVPDEALPGYYRAADAVCVPSTGGESFGIVLLEAMAAGKPIVASRIPGFAAVIEPGGAGLLAPPSDPAALAADLTRALTDRRLAEELGHRARATANAYDWDVLARRLVGLYRGILDAREGRD